MCKEAPGCRPGTRDDVASNMWQALSCDSGSGNSTEPAAEAEAAAEAAPRASVAILWEPASPDDGEEDGQGGAFSDAWVKMA